MSLAAGDTFAGFQIVRMLGAGGMGEVYLVEHPRLPRQEALKILPARFTDDAEFRSRFNREAELVAAIWHPHIVAVHDRGEYDGQLWITMGYVEGTDAFQMIRDRYPSGVPPKLAAEIVTAVADALDYAHERGLLHRDVKPANILLSDADPSSPRRRILLSDFGVAREMEDSTGLTATNMTVGSVAYSAPEQLMGHQLDGRADQYALAATAYQLLTGRPPFENSNAAVVITAHLSSPPPRMGDRRPDLGPLDAVIRKALAKNPADRYPTCRDFASALSSLVAAAPQIDHPTVVAAPSAGPVAGQPTQKPSADTPPPALPAPPPPGPAASTKRSGGRGVWIAAAAIVVALLVVGGVLLVPRLLESDDEPGSSTSTADTAADVLPPSAVDGLLLTTRELTPILGEPLQPGDIAKAPADLSSHLDRTECIGAIYPLESRIYASSDYTAAQQQVFSLPEGVPGNHSVDQSVALLPTAADADHLRAVSQRDWQDCAGAPLTMTETLTDDTTRTSYPTLSQVQTIGDLIIQDRTVTGDGAEGLRCQHTMGVWNNVVAEAVVCDDVDIGDQSQKIVEEILTRASDKY